jgi:hypothetical protein
MDTFTIEHELADIWVARDHQNDVNYAYGGTRMVDPQTSNEDVQQMLTRLVLDESALKNRLIDKATRSGALRSYTESLPRGFLGSSVGGARCVVRPRNRRIAAVLKNPAHPDFRPWLSQLFEPLGALLNQQQGRIKLTPDFGRYAGVADILAQFTPHVLGIRREDGGCGGKSSYAATGIIAALEFMGVSSQKTVPITLIGSAGALGSNLLAYFLKEGFQAIAVCDLVYDGYQASTSPPGTVTCLASRQGAFTESCLQRGNVIVATTVGNELKHSPWQRIPAGTTLLLAHNLAIPSGEEGISLVRQLAARGISVWPGQILTLGGALTSRIEWFWRETRPHELFPKQLAHTVVAVAVRFLLAETREMATTSALTPYEAMLRFADMRPNS